MRLVLQVKDAKGDREIEFEGHSTNNMYRAGYRANMIRWRYGHCERGASPMGRRAAMSPPR